MHPSCLSIKVMETGNLCQTCKAVTATVHCGCQVWVSLCEECYGKHATTTHGPHSKFDITTRQSASTKLCESCCLNTAERKIGETWVCAACSPVFEDNTLTSLPTSTPFSISTSTLPSFLQSELQRMHGSLHTLRSTYDHVLKEVYKQKLKLLADLSHDITEMEQLVNDYLTAPDPEYQLTKYLNSPPNPEIDLSDELQLIRYMSDVTEIALKIPSVCTYTTAKWLFAPQGLSEGEGNPPIIPVFRTINSFFVPPGYQTVDMPEGVAALKQCTGWMYVTDEHLFVCGDEKQAGAYIVTIHGFAYNATARSIYRRSYPCLCRFQDFVYLFGGDLNEAPQRFGERYSLSQDQWSVLPNMQFPRSHCAPCLCKDVFYLLGGKWTSTAEQFDPLRLRFKTLILELPFTGYNFSLPYDQDIYWFSQGRIFSWEVRMGSQYLTEILDFSDEILYYNDTGNPVKLVDEVFFFAQNLKSKNDCLYSFDLSTKKLSLKAFVKNRFTLA